MLFEVLLVPFVEVFELRENMLLLEEFDVFDVGLRLNMLLLLRPYIIYRLFARILNAILYYIKKGGNSYVYIIKS